MPDFAIKQGDVLPVLSDTLTYSDGTSVNLTGASCRSRQAARSPGPAREHRPSCSWGTK